MGLKAITTLCKIDASRTRMTSNCHGRWIYKPKLDVIRSVKSVKAYVKFAQILDAEIVVGDTVVLGAAAVVFADTVVLGADAVVLGADVVVLGADVVVVV